MTRSGGDFQPRPLKRLFTMSRYKNRPCRERNHRVVGKAERLTWHKAWTAVSSGFQFPIREHNLQFGIQRTCHHKCFIPLNWLSTGAGFILNSSRRRPFEKHLSSAISCARLVTSSSLFMVLASPSDVLYPDSPLATSVQYAIHAGYTLFPTGCRPHKPEQNAGE